MKHLSDKSYWSKTYVMGTEKIYALERLERGGFVYVVFRDYSKHREPKRERQKLPGNLRVRDAKGRIDKAKVKDVDNAVATFGAQLQLGQRPDESKKEHALTLSEGFELALDLESGKFPTKSPRWQELGRARAKLERILGKQLAWTDIQPGDARKVGRILATEYKDAPKGTRPCGARQAEVTLDALYSVANWLRDERKIPADAAMAPKEWRAKLKREWALIVGAEVVPARPRHNADELGKLFEAMHRPEVDPRFALAFDLGGEQRLGQVLRCKRSQLMLVEPNATQASIHLGVLRVPSAGHKKAAPIVLTIDQRSAVDSALTGYLSDYEAQYVQGKIKDYPLFPAGRFKSKKAKVVAEPKALTRDAALGMFHELEEIAGVSSVPGRGWYGVRRVAADEAEDIEKDERVLNSITGHRDSTTRRAVYQDSERAEVLKRAALTRDSVRKNAVAKSRQNDAERALRLEKSA